MNYHEWCSWLETRNPSPQIAPGLERMQAALNITGLTQKFSREKIIHIAGTNGKGTTAKALEQLLLSARQTVGLYISPHLVTTRERISINGEMISENDFVLLAEKYKTTIEELHLSHFESLTLFACDYFLQKNVDWLIFEVGLGGTWDATNAIPHTTSVITTIGFDHMHILGDTLEEIADNKFGIIQEQNTVIHGPLSTSLQTQLNAKLQETHSNEVTVAPFNYKVEKRLIPQYFLIINNESYPISLPGSRAIYNLSLAWSTMQTLGFTHLSPQHLSNIQWAARMTPLPIKDSPCPVYLSGDHNLQGIESLLEILKESSYEKITFILGLSKNRTHAPFIEKLLSLRNSSLVLTSPIFQGVEAPEKWQHLFYKDQKEALKQAVQNKTDNDLVVITGSLYLCGDYLRLFPI